MRVRYRTIWMDLPIADCDTTELEDVFKMIRFDKSNKKGQDGSKSPTGFKINGPPGYRGFYNELFYLIPIVR